MDMKSGGKSDKGADFGRGTKNMAETDYKKLQEGNAPKVGSADGKSKITDKTS